MKTKQDKMLACAWECLRCGWVGRTETTGCPKCQAPAEELIEAEPDGNINQHEPDARGDD